MADAIRLADPPRDIVEDAWRRARALTSFHQRLRSGRAELVVETTPPIPVVMPDPPSAGIELSIARTRIEYRLWRTGLEYEAQGQLPDGSWKRVDGPWLIGDGPYDRER